MARPIAAGRGADFRAPPGARSAPAEGTFSPNRGLDISPEFLGQVLGELRRQDIDIVDLDEAVWRLKHGEARRFACFTFDDGYADLLRGRAAGVRGL